MLVLITYDVNTETASGKKRLRKVAKECQNYGQRVQNSVFECIMDNAKAKEVKAKLLEIIDMDKDSLRFYYLGNVYKNKVASFAEAWIEIGNPHCSSRCCYIVSSQR